MIEAAFVLIKKNEDTKEIIVEQRIFAYDSEEAKNAKEKERELFNFADGNGYNIVCDEKIIYDYAEVQELKKKRQKLRELRYRYPKLEEEDIIFLAQLMVQFDKDSITFEDAYQKIKENLAGKKIH